MNGLILALYYHKIPGACRLVIIISLIYVLVCSCMETSLQSPVKYSHYSEILL